MLSSEVENRGKSVFAKETIKGKASLWIGYRKGPSTKDAAYLRRKNPLNHHKTFVLM